MKTRRLFQEDVYMKAAKAVITDIIPSEDGLLLTLDQTIFFPTGGGQSCDRGTAGGLSIAEVFEKNHEIFHRAVEKECKLSIGDEIDIQIDWERRFDNMQRHCGEHILSGKFYQLYGGVNRGFHMGSDYMTIDISLEENPDYDTITWEMAKAAELETNRAIWENLPVITRRFDRREEAEHLPLRKKLTLEAVSYTHLKQS